MVRTLSSSAPNKAPKKARAKTPKRAPKVQPAIEPVWRQQSFKTLFATAQHNKCAYCEMPLTATYHGDVEHYRPIAKVEALTAGERDDTQGEPKRSVLGREVGYDWLAYTWSNYLLACSKCNAVWKRNQFPIRGPRATAPQALQKEKPDLLNPFETDPAPHLHYDEFLGEILHSTKQGEATIQVCGLARKTLEIQRQIKAEKLKRRFSEYEEALVLGNDVAARNALRSILDECRDSSAHAGMARYLTDQKVRLTYAQLLALEASAAI